MAATAGQMSPPVPAVVVSLLIHVIVVCVQRKQSASAVVEDENSALKVGRRSNIPKEHVLFSLHYTVQITCDINICTKVL